MISGQLIAPEQLTDLGVNFTPVHSLMPATVHMSFSLPRGHLNVNKTQKLPQGKGSLVHAHY